MMSDNKEPDPEKSYWKKNPVTVTYPDGQTKTFDNWVPKNPVIRSVDESAENARFVTAMKNSPLAKYFEAAVTKKDEDNESDGK